jgi:hypothetical protein
MTQGAKKQDRKRRYRQEPVTAETAEKHAENAKEDSLPFFVVTLCAHPVFLFCCVSASSETSLRDRCGQRLLGTFHGGDLGHLEGR